MNQLVPLPSVTLPALVTAAGERAGMRFLEFFAANIRNPHTRRAYHRAADEFPTGEVSILDVVIYSPKEITRWSSPREIWNAQNSSLFPFTRRIHRASA